MPGRLIAIEGIDGSGKGTQAALLRERCESRGWKTALLSFPRYQHTFFGARIGEFLNGEFGSLGELHPFLVSLLYAGDRLESRSTLLSALNESDVVILDRYTPSNIAHQSAKLAAVAQRVRLRDWIEHVEHVVYALPHPDLVVLLDIPVMVSQELILRKQQRSYTTQSRDLQEADTGYLQAVREAYLQLAADRSHWSIVPVCDDSQQLRAIADVNNDIWTATAQAMTSG